MDSKRLDLAASCKEPYFEIDIDHIDDVLIAQDAFTLIDGRLEKMENERNSGKMKVEFTLNIPPKPKGRGRAFIYQYGRIGIRTPMKTRQWEHAAAMMIHRHMLDNGIDSPIAGPVSVHAEFVRARTKHRPVPSRRQRCNVSLKDWKTGEEVDCAATPDVDNTCKALLDAMTKAKVWFDDGQVYEIKMTKKYAAVGAKPCIRVTINWREE